MKVGDKVRNKFDRLPLGGTVEEVKIEKNNPSEWFYDWTEGDDFEVEILVIDCAGKRHEVKSEEYNVA